MKNLRLMIKREYAMAHTTLGKIYEATENLDGAIGPLP